MCEYCEVASYEELCKCKIDGGVCPYMYRCRTKMMWKELDDMPQCTIRRDKMKGNVRFEKNGYLYIDVKGMVIKIKNPYDYIPENIDIIQSKDGSWKVKKKEED